MASKKGVTKRRAVAGRCPACNARTLRGVDNEGDPVEVELPALTAAAELRLTMAGSSTWSAKWQGGVELTKRSPADVRDSPAGYAPGNVYAPHRCEGAT